MRDEIQTLTSFLHDWEALNDDRTERPTVFEAIF